MDNAKKEELMRRLMEVAVAAKVAVTKIDPIAMAAGLDTYQRLIDALGDKATQEMKDEVRASCKASGLTALQIIKLAAALTPLQAMDKELMEYSDARCQCDDCKAKRNGEEEVVCE